MRRGCPRDSADICHGASCPRPDERLTLGVENNWGGSYDRGDIRSRASGWAKQAYLDIAAEMRPMVEEVEGFISVERFQSLTDPNKLLSLSFFEDDAAVARWRQLVAHRRAQEAGRSGLFADYRLRVAHILRDYGKHDRDQAPQDSRDRHGA